MKNKESVSAATLHRLPSYLNYLKLKEEEGETFISSRLMADELGQNPIQVRKDLAGTGVVGRPKMGFPIHTLIAHISDLLGYNNVKDAVLAGFGGLGRALMSYEGFYAYGLRIVAAFDANPAVCDGRQVFPPKTMPSLIRRLNIKIGIITVPGDQAQAVCDQLIASGIMAVWNFAPVHLQVPPGILVQNENMAASLSMLSKHLAKRLEAEKE